MTESEFQKQVIDLAHLRGWCVAHFRPARTSKGWRTPVAADGKGFPDLIMLRHGWLIVAELKASRGKTKNIDAEQEAWLEAFRQVENRTGAVKVYLWSPEDWDEIERVLCLT